MSFFGESTFRWIGHMVINSAGNGFIRLYGLAAAKASARNPPGVG